MKYVHASKGACFEPNRVAVDSHFKHCTDVVWKVLCHGRQMLSWTRELPVEVKDHSRPELL